MIESSFKLNTRNPSISTIQLSDLNSHCSDIKVISINLLVVYRESVNLTRYITRRLLVDSLGQNNCSHDCIRDPLSKLNQYTWREWRATFEPDET